MNLVTALGQQNVEAHIATTNDDGRRKVRDVPLQQLHQTGACHTIYFPKQTEFYAASIPMLRWLVRHASDYDLIHIHGLFNFSSTLGAHAANFHKVPYVLTPHGTLNQWGLNNRRPTLKKISLAALESRIVGRAGLLHFTSEHEKREAVTRPLGNSRTAVVPLGLDISTFAQLSTSSQPSGIDQTVADRPTILFLSRIDRIKNLDVLLHAMKLLVDRLPSVLLYIAGDGDADLISELKNLARSLDIEKNVSWVGFVSDPQKQWLFSRSRLLAMPSKFENFGLSAAEALANGVPVVVSENVGIAPLVRKYCAGSVVAEQDVAQLAYELYSWLSNDVACVKAAATAKRLVQEEISLPVFGRRMADLYGQVTTENI